MISLFRRRDQSVGDHPLVRQYCRDIACGVPITIVIEHAERTAAALIKCHRVADAAALNRWIDQMKSC